MINKIIVISNLGLGDNIFSISLIRFFLENYQVDFMCKKNNIENFILFFDKITNLTFIPVENKSDVDSYMNSNHHLYNRIFKSGCMMNVCSNLSIFPFFLYDDINLPRSILNEYFSIPDTKKNNDLFELIKNYSYVVINNDTSDYKNIFNIDTELKKLNINPNDTIIINTQINYYKKEHKYFNIAEQFVFQKLVDYKKTMSNAFKILISDSSLFCMTIQLNLKSSENKLYNRPNNKFINWQELLNYYGNKFIIGN